MYWKMKFWCCPGVGHLQLFQNKMTNARQMPEEGWARLELTEP